MNLELLKTLPESAPTNTRILRQVDVWVQQADQPGTEGFLSNLFIKMTDGIFGILNNFKAMIADPRKMAKRSELQAFRESNAIKIKKLEALMYTDVHTIQLPVPTGLIPRYPELVSSLSMMLNAIDMDNKSTLAKEKMKAVHDTLISGNSISTQLKAAFATFDSRLKGKLSKDLKKITVPTRKVMEHKYSTLFKSVGEFRDVDTTLLQMVKYYHEIHRVHGNLLKIEEFLENMINTLQDTKDLPITKSDIKTLGNIAYLYAETFDMYGILIQHYHRVDHNFTECHKSMFKALGW